MVILPLLASCLIIYQGSILGSALMLEIRYKVKLDSAADVLDYSKNIIELTACGALSVSQGEAMGRLLDKHSRLLEAEQLEARIEALEADRDIA
jgi:hypothetical protein